jgi:hypothetical protein
LTTPIEAYRAFLSPAIDIIFEFSKKRMQRLREAAGQRSTTENNYAPLLKKELVDYFIFLAANMVYKSEDKSLKCYFNTVVFV